MSNTLKLAVLGFVISFVISLSHPLIIFFYLPKPTQPARWIQNNPSYTVFLLSSFPAAVAVFVATINWQVISYWTAGWRLLVFGIVIGLIFVIVTLAVRDNFTSHPIGPYVLKRKQAEESFALEMELRRARPSKGFLSDSLRTKRNDYQKLIHLKSGREILKRGGPVAYVHLGLAWIVTFFISTYFFYMAFLLVKTGQEGINFLEGEKEKLAVIFVLLLPWFPMRIYTEWYQNEFHRPDWLKQYSAFWTLAFLAVAYLWFVIVMLRPQGTSILILTALTPLIPAAVGKFKPEWLRLFARYLASLPFIYFVVICLVFVVIGATTAFRFIH
jgi:hypothetical protein